MWIPHYAVRPDTTGRASLAFVQIDQRVMETLASEALPLLGAKLKKIGVDFSLLTSSWCRCLGLHICTGTRPTHAHIGAGTGLDPAHIRAWTGLTPSHIGSSASTSTSCRRRRSCACGTSCSARVRARARACRVMRGVRVVRVARVSRARACVACVSCHLPLRRCVLCVRGEGVR